jgi:hypothetical protein
MLPLGTYMAFGLKNGNPLFGTERCLEVVQF